MDSRCALLTAFGVLALLACPSLKADDPFMPLSTNGTKAIAHSAWETNGNVADETGLNPQPSATPSVDPASWAAQPACSQDFAQSNCGNCLPSACAECDPGLKVKFVPYGWLFEAHGNATVRGVTAPVHISTRDLLDIMEHDVHFFFSGKLEMECDEWGLIADGFYVNAGFADHVERFNFSSPFKQAIVDIAFTYQLEDMPELLSLPPSSRFDLLAGGRYWLLEGGLTVTGPLGNTATASGEKEWVDPFVGGRIITPLSELTDLQLRGDVGGFGWGTASEFTWNMEAVVAVRCSESCSLRGGYRILDVNNHRNSGNDRFGFDVQFRGPIAELALEF